MHTTPMTQQPLKEINESQLNGSYFLNSHLAHTLKTTLRSYDGFGKLNAVQSESLENMMSIISHIINGDSHYINHWQELQHVINHVVKDMQIYWGTFESKKEYYQVSTCPF